MMLDTVKTPPIASPLSAQLSSAFTPPLTSPTQDTHIHLISTKQVILVIDTSIPSHIFTDINNNYLSPLLGHLVETSLQHNVEMAIVLYRGYSLNFEPLVRCSPFTQDYKELRSWLSSIKFGLSEISGGYGTPYKNNLVEGLCAVQKINELTNEMGSDYGEKYLIIVANGAPSPFSCKSCQYLGDTFAHAIRLAKSKFLLSIISPQHTDGIVQLFEAAKPEQEDIPTNTKIGDPLILLRGLSPVSPATPVATPMMPVPDVQVIEKKESVTVVPPVPKHLGAPLWEGILFWQLQVGGTPTPTCDIAAHPSPIRPESDFSVYAVNEWGQSLNIIGLLTSKDSNILPYYKIGKVVEFLPISKTFPPGKSELGYKNVVNQLLKQNAMAVVQLANRTMLIIPNANASSNVSLEEKSKSMKLVGLIIPKLSSRSNSGGGDLKNKAALASVNSSKVVVGQMPSAGSPSYAGTNPAIKGYPAAYPTQTAFPTSLNVGQPNYNVGTNFVQTGPTNWNAILQMQNQGRGIATPYPQTQSHSVDKS